MALHKHPNKQQELRELCVVIFYTSQRHLYILLNVHPTYFPTLILSVFSFL